jgi:hypothetical protein
MKYFRISYLGVLIEEGLESRTPLESNMCRVTVKRPPQPGAFRLGKLHFGGQTRPVGPGVRGHHVGCHSAARRQLATALLAALQLYARLARAVAAAASPACDGSIPRHCGAAQGSLSTDHRRDARLDHAGTREIPMDAATSLILC